MAQSVAYAAEAQVRRSRFRWVVLGLIFAIYTVASADRANIGIALPYIQKDFGLTNTQVGAIVSLFALAYGIFQIPSAFLIRRFGVRAVLPFFMILTSIFTATIGLIGFFSAALGAVSAAFLLQANRFALGVAEAPLANSLMTSINNWFPAQEKGQAAGIFISSAKLGPVIVPPVGALVILYFGWQHLFFACALPGILLPSSGTPSVPNDPAESRFCSPAEQELIAGTGARDVFARLGASCCKPAEPRPSRRAFRASGGPCTAGWVAGPADPGSGGAADQLGGHAVPVVDGMGRGAGLLLCPGDRERDPGVVAHVPEGSEELLDPERGLCGGCAICGGGHGQHPGRLASGPVLSQAAQANDVSVDDCDCGDDVLAGACAQRPGCTGLAAVLTGLMLSIGFSAFGIYPSNLTTKKVFPLGTALVNTCGQIGGAAIPFAVGLILDRANWDAVFLFLSGCSVAALLLLLTIIKPIEPSNAKSKDT